MRLWIKWRKISFLSFLTFPIFQGVFKVFSFAYWVVSYCVEYESPGLLLWVVEGSYS
jgi:hypothetical protein